MITISSLLLLLAAPPATASDFDAAETACGDKDAGAEAGVELPARRSPHKRRLGRRVHIHGIVDMEALLAQRGYDVNEVEVLYARLDHSLLAPERARREGRQTNWRRSFGRPQLTVARERLSDGETVFSEKAVDRPRPWYTDDRAEERAPQRLCVDVPYYDRGPVELATWTDIGRVTVGAQDLEARDLTTTLMMVDDLHSATMAHLAPGESVTVVEMLEPHPRQPTRKVTLEQSGHTMVVLQESEEQTICMEY